MYRKSLVLTFLLLFVGMDQLSIAEENLSKKSQNPVGNIISLPF